MIGLSGRLKALLHELRRVSDENFWGEINVKFQAGNPVMLVKKQKLKIEDSNQEATSRNNRRTFHDTEGSGHGSGRQGGKASEN